MLWTLRFYLENKDDRLAQNSSADGRQFGKWGKQAV